MESFPIKSGASVRVLVIFAAFFFYSALSLPSISEGDRLRIQNFVNSFRKAHANPYPLRPPPPSTDNPELWAGQCGGFVELSGQTLELYYKIPGRVKNVSCIWVIWSKYGRSLQVKNLSNMRSQNPGNWQVQALYNGPKNWKSVELDTFETHTLEVNEDHGYALLFFNGNRMTTNGPNFHVQLSETGNKWVNNFFNIHAEIILFESTYGYSVFKYPLCDDECKYKDNERLFIIGHVPEGKLLKWKLHYDVEKNSDWLGLFWLHGSRWNKYVSTGLGSTDNQTPIPAGNSFIITFASDSGWNEQGFQFQYINENTRTVNGL